jgi:CheY-like chemotaxis protein
MSRPQWHILLIDDSADDRADLRQMLLRGAGRRYHFSEAELGADAHYAGRNAFPVKI